MTGSSAVAAALSLLAGFAGSVQVAVMGKFGERIGVLEALAFSTLVTAALAAAALVVTQQSVGGFAAAVRQPAWLWIGGVMGVFIVFTVTVAAPRIGTAATVGIFIGGQLAMAAVIDRFGLFGLERLPLRWPRLLGIALLAAGAALSLRR